MNFSHQTENRQRNGTLLGRVLYSVDYNNALDFFVLFLNVAIRQMKEKPVVQDVLFPCDWPGSDTEKVDSLYGVGAMESVPCHD